MSDVNKAHEVMEKSDHIGKIVLSIKGEKKWICTNTKQKYY
jgi:hypothetical protein